MDRGAWHGVVESHTTEILTLSRCYKCVRPYFGGSKITADGDCSHEIKRRLLLGWKVMVNLDSIFGEDNGTLLQCSCLENPRDGGAWWAAVYGVAQSRTQLK